MSKELEIYQYPFTIFPEITQGDTPIRRHIIKYCSKFKQIYGECLISGDSLYSLKKVDEAKEIKIDVHYKGKKEEYTLNFQKIAKERKIKQEDIYKDNLTKQFIELIIKDILYSNPKLEFYKGFFVINSDKKKVGTGKFSVNFYPGFSTSFVETHRGNFLNVAIKNKIIQSETILDFLNQYKYENKANHNCIKENLINRGFKVCYTKRNYYIEDILFDRTPKTQTFSSNGKTYNLIDYYEKAYKIKIKNVNQPLILVRRKNSNEEVQNLYFVPELCFLSGLQEEETKNGMFMKELAKLTKLEPTERVNKTNEFIKLLEDPTKHKKNLEKLSAKEKSDFYGIKIKPLKHLFTAYYMKEPKLLGGNKKQVHSNDRAFPVLEKKEMTNWICFYEKCNYDDADNLYKTLSKSSKAFGIKLSEPEWVEMPNKSNSKDWTDTADDYFNKGQNKYNFVIFLLGRNDYIYPQLKKHSLCTNGYVSQVVKTRSIQKKGSMSVCSKILLQINAKLRGVSYKAIMNKKIEEIKLMVIGVDSCHISGKRTGVAMVASVNNSFTDFYNKQEIIEEKNKQQLQFCISSFIEESIVAFTKQNSGIPKGIVIYRQGVSLQQKKFLKTEIQQIDQVCKTKNILYYYILVNTKNSFKFFEKSGNSYSNPSSGLLILDGVTNRNFFEFYIQPQEVNQGSATPTCFHVAFGNLNIPEIIPKFTFDLCHIYSNWQGTIRIPNVIKLAEKLSKMTAKYKLDSINNSLKLGQAYL